MVEQMGMSDVIGPRNIQKPSQSQEGSFIGNDLQKKADGEIDRILSEQYDRGLHLLSENKDVLDAIAKSLIENEKIDGKQLLEVIQSVNPSLVSQSEIDQIENFLQPQ